MTIKTYISMFYDNYNDTLKDNKRRLHSIKRVELMVIVVRANRGFWAIEDLEKYGYTIIGIEEHSILCVMQ